MKIVSSLFVAVFLSIAAAGAEQPASFSFRKLREQHHTKLRAAVPVPPKDIFKLVAFESPAGKLNAYVSPDPGDGARHPVIIWLVGGFSNSIGDHLWQPADASNDQTAAAYRQAGVLMMFPSLRGGEGNPGRVEVCCGEVDDVIAAAKHVAALPYVDPQRVYLGGHSTGGTLALLVAGSCDMFRAVISYGPVHSVAGYGQDNLPFDAEDRTELMVRAPIICLPEIKTPTFVLEGSGGNIQALKLMKEKNPNKLVHFHEIPGASHFNTLAPFNQLWAQKILQDTGKECNLGLTADEVKKTAVLVAEKLDSAR